MSKEYSKEFDAAMRQVHCKLKEISADDSRAKDVINILDKVGLDVNYTETGLAMGAAIEHARSIFKRIYDRANISGNLGIITIIEYSLKGDPFYGDFLENRKES
jgi:hypothetical protein